MKKIMLLLISVVLAACATVKEQTRLSTGLQVKEFNSIASQYYERPTFVSLNKMSNGSNALLVEVDPYRPRPYDMNSMITFGQDQADAYVSMIDKFLEWETIAQERQDQIEKKIGSASDGTGVLDLTFTFYSGNANQHYLIVANCDALCSDQSDFHYYDKNNATQLKALLTRLKANQFTTDNVDNIYQ